MIEITTVEEFNEVVENSAVVLADFYAPWCGPCKMLMPMLENEVEPNYEGVSFIKLNVDDKELGEIVHKYGIMSVPTIIILKGGEVAAKLAGFQPQEAYETALDGALS